MTKEINTKITIVGSGTAGLTVAAQLMRKEPHLHGDITIIDPSENHYFQPEFTLVGAGESKLEDTVRKQETLIPKGVNWVQESVVEFFPEENYLTTDNETKVNYEYLVVAGGIQLDWDKVKGLEETIGKNGVCSNFSPKYVESTWDNVRNFKGGKAIVTQPSTPIKCPGAPKKVLYLVDDYFKKTSIRHKSEVELVTGLDRLCPVDYYNPGLVELTKEKGIAVTELMDLIEIDGPNKKATFKSVEHDETITRDFDMIHVTPFMSSPDFIANSPIADEAGWVDVNEYTLRHNKYENVFSAGDCSSLPTGQTGAAIRGQAPVLVDNLLAAIHNKEMNSKYDGYSACPYVTSYNTVIMAEFVYGDESNIYGYKPTESFPFDQRKESKSMYLLNKHLMPMMYWNGMLRGTM